MGTNDSQTILEKLQHKDEYRKLVPEKFSATIDELLTSVDAASGRDLHVKFLNSIIKRVISCGAACLNRTLCVTISILSVTISIDSISCPSMDIFHSNSNLDLDIYINLPHSLAEYISLSQLEFVIKSCNSLLFHSTKFNPKYTSYP